MTSSEFLASFLANLKPFEIYPPVNPGIINPKLANAIPPKSFYLAA
jgi:hypothetical protein